MKYRWVQNGKVISEGTLVPGSHEEHLQSLVDRAAKLLSHRFDPQEIYFGDWKERCDQWLKDAEVEK